MVRRVRGKQGGHCRRKLRKHRETTTITARLQTFEVGDKVVIDIDPSTQDGMPHPRFQGVEGVVDGKRGDCYEVSILDGGKKKTLVVNPVHLKKVKK